MIETTFGKQMFDADDKIVCGSSKCGCLNQGCMHIFKANRVKMFGAVHFIYYINRSIATKVD